MGQSLGYGDDDLTFSGHAIEARLYAEDPANDFLPATGVLHGFEPADEPALRWDTGVVAGSAIGVDFDPMIAKVIAKGPTRADAAGRLALGLERLHLGGVVTNRDFLATVLRSPEFLAGDTTTDFIDRVGPEPRRTLSDEQLQFLATAAALWLQGENRAEARTLTSIPSGYVIGRLPPERVQLAVADRHDRQVTVYYRGRRDGSFTLGANGTDGRAMAHGWADDRIDVEVNGHRSTALVTRAGSALHLTGAGLAAELTIVPRFSVPEIELPGGAVAAPMPGQVLEIRVAVGDRVEAGQIVAVLEAMKMENHLAAPDDGVVTEVRVAEGDQVTKDVLLMVIEAEPTVERIPAPDPRP
jgi:propionyl-CoA carboxylase alpha chain